MEFLLSEANYQVHNMGPNTPMRDVVDWLKQHPCDLIVVSTVNGHGYLEGVELAQRIRDEGRFRGSLCIGGKICTENDAPTLERYSHTLLQAGFDAVFDDSDKNNFDRFQALLDNASAHQDTLARSGS
ncbi:hypothetical protein [Pseudomonas xantholysinigenes]|uniref:B12-binding domain-containing protein n=1 Tax=Pseudomonas xantholysinigenes TaxID=2745490 RepID=A0A9E6PW75_9PSED|nr:hypothetical protein [Pseudomonas xantholysinigenes]QXI37880.1 hypothetical protein HU772_021530 [Pseudomonas xantholysinigenes]